MVALISTALALDKNPCEGLVNGSGKGYDSYLNDCLNNKEKKFTGFVNDYSSCPAYFSCLGYTAFELNCPNGLYFDGTRGVCDFPQNVQCSMCPPTGIRSVRTK